LNAQDNGVIVLNKNENEEGSGLNLLFTNSKIDTIFGTVLTDLDEQQLKDLNPLMQPIFKRIPDSKTEVNLDEEDISLQAIISN